MSEDVPGLWMPALATVFSRAAAAAAASLDASVDLHFPGFAASAEAAVAAATLPPRSCRSGGDALPCIAAGQHGAVLAAFSPPRDGGRHASARARRTRTLISALPLPSSSSVSEHEEEFTWEWRGWREDSKKKGT